jgi:hypothetical protein
MEAFQKMKVADLKDELKSRGLQINGNKQARQPGSYLGSLLSTLSSTAWHHQPPFTLDSRSPGLAISLTAIMATSCNYSTSRSRLNPRVFDDRIVRFLAHAKTDLTLPVAFDLLLDSISI